TTPRRIASCSRRAQFRLQVPGSSLRISLLVTDRSAATSRSPIRRLRRLHQGGGRSPLDPPIDRVQLIERCATIRTQRVRTLAYTLPATLSAIVGTPRGAAVSCRQEVAFWTPGNGSRSSTRRTVPPSTGGACAFSRTR